MVQHWRKIVAFVAAFATLVITLLAAASPQRSTTMEPVVVGTPMSLGEVVVEDERHTITEDDILWIARGIYSETKRSEEQELVAWVIRNRYETEYRGKATYKDVVLDPYQFSAFNPNSRVRRFYTTLGHTSRAAGWKTAIEIARKVAHADLGDRPFSHTTRHFYSERSMRGGRKPNWAYNKKPVKLDRQIDPRRFRFYADIA